MADLHDIRIYNTYMHTHIWGPYTCLHLHAACPNYNTGNDHRPTRIKPPLLYTTLHCCAQYVTNAVPIKSFHFCASTRRCMKGRGAGRGWTAAYGREEVWQVFLLRKGFNVSMHASSSICGLQELAALAMRQRTLGNGAGAAAEGGVLHSDRLYTRETTTPTCKRLPVS